MGLTFLGQIRLVCQHCLEEKIEVVETLSHTHTERANRSHTACTHSEHTKNMQRCGCVQMKLIPHIRDVIQNRSCFYCASNSGVYLFLHARFGALKLKLYSLTLDSESKCC